MVVLEPFRDAIIDELRNYIKFTKHKVEDLDPILTSIVDKTFEDFEREGKSLSGLNQTLILVDLIIDAKHLLSAVLSQSKKLEAVKHKILTYGSVFVVGAGLSTESKVFTTSDLEDVLRFVKAKNFEELRANDTKCFEFKKKIEVILKGKKPGKSHKIIARNFPENIREIVDLNWDNLLEIALTELGKSNVKINKDIIVSSPNHLWKFHGDVNEFDRTNVPGKLGWVFPDENGYVFDHFMEYVADQRLNEDLFTIIIVGYSESEKEVKKVINSLELDPPRPTYRIGMNLGLFHDQGYIVGPSAYVLPRILEQS